MKTVVYLDTGNSFSTQRIADFVGRFSNYTVSQVLQLLLSTISLFSLLSLAILLDVTTIVPDFIPHCRQAKGIFRM